MSWRRVVAFGGYVSTLIGATAYFYGAQYLGAVVISLGIYLYVRALIDE